MPVIRLPEANSFAPYSSAASARPMPCRARPMGESPDAVVAHAGDVQDVVVGEREQAGVDLGRARAEPGTDTASRA
jgi:hypothetical protein